MSLLFSWCLPRIYPTKDKPPKPYNPVYITCTIYQSKLPKYERKTKKFAFIADVKHVNKFFHLYLEKENVVTEYS